MKRKEAERIVKQSYLDKGYRVISNGWPDLVAIKGNEIEFIEVKVYKEKLSDSQLIMHHFFRHKLRHPIKTIRLHKSGSLIDNSNRIIEPEKINLIPIIE